MTDYKYSFEKLDVWNKARQLVSIVYQLTSDFPSEEKFGLTNQIRRSAVSVSSNIAEGSSRFSKKEQFRYYEIAYGSATECLSQFIIAVDLNYLNDENFSTIRKKISTITFALSKLKSHYKLQEPEVPYQQTQPSSTKNDNEKNSNKQINESSNQQPEDSIKHFNTSTDQQSEESNQQINKSTDQQSLNPELIITPNYQQHYTAIIDDNCTIGKGTKIWHFSHIMSGCTLGNSCNIGQNVVISPDVVLGNNVKVQNNVSIYTGVTCDDDVFLGPSMVFTNVINPRSAVNRKGQYSKTHVGQGATIGANSTIVCGNDIGKFAFIGAGAVVTKYIPDYALVVGNPSKQIGWMSEYGHKLLFDENGSATCPESNEEYKLENEKVTKI